MSVRTIALALLLPAAALAADPADELDLLLEDLVLADDGDDTDLLDDDIDLLEADGDLLGAGDAMLGDEPELDFDDEPPEDDIGYDAAGLPTFEHLDDDGAEAFEFEEPALPPPPPGTTASLGFDVTGLAPLTDAFPVQIHHAADGFVVAELPVLIAQGRADVAESFDVVVAMSVGEAAPTVLRMTVSPEALPLASPSVWYAKAVVPVTAGGNLQAVVSRDSGGKTEALYTRSAELDGGMTITGGTDIQ